VPEVHFIGEVVEGVGFSDTFVSCKWWVVKLHRLSMLLNLLLNWNHLYAISQVPWVGQGVVFSWRRRVDPNPVCLFRWRSSSMESPHWCPLCICKHSRLAPDGDASVGVGRVWTIDFGWVWLCSFANKCWWVCRVWLPDSIVYTSLSCLRLLLFVAISSKGIMNWRCTAGGQAGQSRMSCSPFFLELHRVLLMKKSFSVRLGRSGVSSRRSHQEL
jgi:hypothetical protein